MTGQLTATLDALTEQSTPAPTTHASTTTASPASTTQDAEAMIMVPAGWLGDVVGSLAGVAGKAIGRHLGNEALGSAIGGAAGPLIKHFTPFTIDPPVDPQSTSPQASDTESEPMVVVPAGFLSGILGGVGGKLLGGVVGGWLGNKQLGAQIGSTLGGTAGSAFGPFSVVPAPVAPASAGEAQSGDPQEPMVLVPAGFFGRLAGGIARAVGGRYGGKTGAKLGEVAGGVLEKVVPWQALPAELTPAASGNGQEAESDIVVPAAWLGSMASLYGSTIRNVMSCQPGRSPFGSAMLTEALKAVKPFEAVPAELVPMSSGPDGQPAEELIAVPAGIFGGMLSSLGGALGSAVGKHFGHEQIGGAVGGALGKLGGKFFPFQVVPDSE